MFGGRPGGWDVGHADCVYAITTGGGTGSTSSDALSLCHEGGPVALWVTIRSGARTRVSDYDASEHVSSKVTSSPDRRR